MNPGPAAFGQTEARNELRNIAGWWLRHAPDTLHGGFVGEIDYHGQPVKNASKGIILNSRILWFFSEAGLFEKNPEYRVAADRAYQYLINYFDDRDYGGAVWELAADGTLANGKKQVYALCFCIYAFTAYYRLTSNPQALNKSLEYFHALETHARNQEYNGYSEAFSRQWQHLEDVRLGEGDMNAARTMNTHLHLLEAYTALHSMAPGAQTEEALRHTIGLLCKYFIDPENGHLRLFFDDQWRSLSSRVSFGHDIETSWLLWEAAESLADPALLDQIRPVVERMADACLREGIGAKGQLCDEYDPVTKFRSEAGVWWVQAEALVGFLNAFKLTGEQRYCDACDRIWQYIGNHHIDTTAGEWHWLSSAPEAEVRSHYKAGFWKAPYHNGRAMIQACSLLKAL